MNDKINIAPRVSGWNSRVLFLSMFIMGATGLAYEYTLSKLASDLLGNSAQQWALVIGVMMFFMGIGADLQKHLKDNVLLESFLLAEIALGLIGAFSPLILLMAYGEFYSHFALIQYFFIAVIGMLIGFEIPLLARINSQYVASLPFNLGGILKMDYIGALCGALVWVFVLTRYFSLVKLSFILGIVTLISAIAAFCYFHKQIQKPTVIVASFVITLSLIATGFVQADRWTVFAEQHLYRDRIEFSESSIYQHMVLTKSANDHVSLYLNGHLQFNSSDEHIYHEMLVHPAMLAAKKHDNVVVLGGGDGLAVREILKYDDVKQITLVDLDPMVTKIARSNPLLVKLNGGSLNNARVSIVKNQANLPSETVDLLVASQNKRFNQDYNKVGQVQIVNIDAVQFLEQVPSNFDVAILDFPDPNAPDLAKLYSQRLYALLAKRMSTGGVIAQQSSSPYHAKESFLSIGRTMKASGLTAIPYHQNIPSFGDWGWWLAVKAQDASEKQLRSKIENVQNIAVATRYLTPSVLRSSLYFGKDQLKSNNNSINTATSMVVYHLYMQGWERQF